MKRIRSKYDEATLAMAAMIPNMEAVGQWQAKCYTNAEIVGVHLVESKGGRDGR